jgi:alkanesulfonate monooxygenase SsuD/methylene tetrahydromethanopterin reductase-like flavin-dependent oxidoreductase (luciferase family)
VAEGRIDGIAFLMGDVLERRLVDDRHVPGSVRNLREFLELGPLLEKHFRRVWITDNLGYRSTFVMLAAAAREWKSLNLGTFTSFPYGRSPIDLTVMANSIAELMPDRELVLGISRGNRIISRTYEPHKPIATQRETIRFIRQLQAGEKVELADYPALQKVCGFRPDSVAQLYMEPQDVPIFMGSTGAKTLEMAGEEADGVFFVTQQPNQSREAWRRGIYGDVSGINDVRRGRERSKVEGFRMMNGISICVSHDGDEAREFARREVAGITGSKSDEVLASIGMDMERTRLVREAFDKGAGFGGASKYISQEMVDKIVIAGTPAEVIDKIAETAEYGWKEGFDEQFFCLPLGPDLKEALSLITGEIMPALA